MANIISEILRTIESFQMPVIIPEICDVSVKLNDKGEKARIYNSYTNLGGNKIQTNIILFHTIIFQVFDMKIDQMYNEIIGAGFYRKYRAIPKDNAFLIAMRESYRIMYFIRNIIVHNQGELKFENGSIIAKYEQKKNNKINNYSVSISMDSLRVIYGIAYLISKFDINSSEYNKIIICSMFSYVMSKGIVFHDEIYANENEEIEHIDPMFLLKWRRRYRQKEVDCQFDQNDGKVKLINAFEIIEEEKEMYGCNYHMSLLDKNYVVPSELFDAHYHVPISDLSAWEFNSSSGLPYHEIYRPLAK